MASQNRRPVSRLKFEMLKEGYDFTFFQAVRLLRLFAEPMGESAAPDSLTQDNLRIRPDLSLAFPAADIARIEESPEYANRFQIFATFLGLYGSSSPLPTFYTEELMDEAAEDESASRDFIDIFNHRLFLLLFHAWGKYRPVYKIVEEGAPEYLERLYALLGLGEAELREGIPKDYPLLRYIGLFTQHPRSAAGLKALLMDVIEPSRVEIVPGIARKAKIPPDQRSHLGRVCCMLGESAYLGDEIDDRMGKVRLRIGPRDHKQFASLSPGQPEHQKLVFYTDLYLNRAMEFDLELVLPEGEAQSARLGVPDFAELGRNTWVGAPKRNGEVTVVFQA